MATKVVKSKMTMMIRAGTAGPSPPVGPKIGSMGLNIMNFCKEFNARTATVMDGVPINTMITAFEDKTYELEVFSPPVSYFILRVAGLPIGSRTGYKENVGQISVKAVYEIAKIKQKDSKLKHHSLKSLCKSIIASARSCGVLVVPNVNPNLVFPSPRGIS